MTSSSAVEIFRMCVPLLVNKMSEQKANTHIMGNSRCQLFFVDALINPDTCFGSIDVFRIAFCRKAMSHYEDGRLLRNTR